MSLTVKVPGRQAPIISMTPIYGKTAAALAALVAAGTVTPGVIVVPADSGVAVVAADLPVGAIVTGGRLVADVPFDATTTNTISVGDSASATRYLSAQSVHTATNTALTPTGYKTLATTNTVYITWTGGTPSALTAGTARLIIEYIVDGRAESTCG